jgi:2-keto-4-pentenoate hydratase/2-oxohepta-3-ene-1,7-dioic acid hydratase in catechol pathway
LTQTSSSGVQWKLATVSSEGRERAALVVGDRLYAIESHPWARRLLDGDGPPTMLGILGLWAEWHPALEEAASRLAASAEVRAAAALRPDARLRAPVPNPRKVLCAGSNYGSHAREMGHEPLDKSKTRPFFFLKPSSAIIGPDEPICIPAGVEKVDWEGELAAIIGRTAKNVPLERAAEHVAGYTIFNDVSARDTHRREDWGEGAFYWDWLQSKGCDTFGPMGPYLVPRSQIGDPYNLRLTLSVNGTVQQDATTSDLIFNVEEQIAYLSTFVTLEPGDVISTGTPPGVGAPRGIFLKRGDEVVVSIDGIGALRNPVA